jgi:hypothetical protein
MVRRFPMNRANILSILLLIGLTIAGHRKEKEAG